MTSGSTPWPCKACGATKNICNDGSCKAAVPQLRRTDDRFKATHRHKEGGHYEMRAMLRVHVGGEWKPAVLYRNASMAQFVRELLEFYDRFEPIEPA